MNTLPHDAILELAKIIIRKYANSDMESVKKLMAVIKFLKEFDSEESFDDALKKIDTQIDQMDKLSPITLNWAVESKMEYFCIEELKKHNKPRSKNNIIEIIKNIFDSKNYELNTNEKDVENIDSILRKHNLKFDMERDYDHGGWKINDVVGVNQIFVDTPTLLNTDYKAVNDQTKKIIRELNKNEYENAITTCQTLMEEVFSVIIKNPKIYEENKKSLTNLYQKSKNIISDILPQKSEPVKNMNNIATGLYKVTDGVRALRNDMSSSHRKKHKPFEHHARLAVNSSLTLCEYMMAIQQNYEGVDLDNGSHKKKEKNGE